LLCTVADTAWAWVAVKVNMAVAGNMDAWVTTAKNGLL
jgi:hypothetical protein